MDNDTKAFLSLTGMVLAGILLFPVAIELAMWIARQP